MDKRPSWDEIFMFQAISCAVRHSCLKRPIGAVLIKDRRIIGTGYNGAAPGITSCRELGYCYYDKLAFEEVKTNGGDIKKTREIFKIYCQAVHAEVNSLSRCARNEAQGSTLFITSYPCPKCVRDVVVVHGIKELRVWKDYLQNPHLTIDERRASEHKLLETGVSVKFIKLTEERIMEISVYMAKQVGERTDYKFKEKEV
ncbi:hypothetical protein KKG85_02695 [Patescibacteria group bacterium]|nr:hypothetical protein [Patescibacteria group bacterium]MBU2579772.1 hypothetical protein [Patescibacteria group bacterium]MBU4082370.1 hypothetical protein [Patescibacteria group bacterium]MCG2808850.1 deaminase [Candidatus Portnoybacteria bacterium]